MDVQLTRYKNIIHEKELLSNLCTSTLTIGQVNCFIHFFYLYCFLL